jgi:DNA repair protein RecO (recombination protein O)
MHVLAVAWDERPGAEIASLVEATIARPRLGLVHDLERLEAAGHALRWIRRAAPPHTPEPEVWREVNALLDDLDDRARPVAAGPRLAAMGLRLLAAVGWGLDLERCVRCGKPCDPAASGFLDPASGGLVCRACGGGRVLLRAAIRARLARAAAGDDDALEPGDASLAIELVEQTLGAHAGETGLAP